MKKVITYGTFDTLHIGHINLLERVKSLGDYLIVAVSTDEFNLKKGKKSLYSFNERKKILESIRFVDKVIEEYSWEQKINDIEKFDISVFAIGDDWKGKFDFLNTYCEVIYLERTKGISSTIVKKGV